MSRQSIPPAPQAQFSAPDSKMVEAWMSRAEAIHKLNMQKYGNYLKAQIQPNITGDYVGPAFFYNRSRDAFVRKIQPDHTRNTVEYPYGL